MGNTGIPDPLHPEDTPDDGESWRGEPEPQGQEDYSKHIPHLKELQFVPMQEMTRVVQALRGTLHEVEGGEVGKMEAACAWVSAIDMTVILLKHELEQRLREMYQKKANDDMPFILDRTISNILRSDYMTRVNKEIAEDLKKTYGVDLIADQGKLLRG